jgi:hypothetical protein
MALASLAHEGVPVPGAAMEAAEAAVHTLPGNVLWTPDVPAADGDVVPAILHWQLDGVDDGAADLAFTYAPADGHARVDINVAGPVAPAADASAMSTSCELSAAAAPVPAAARDFVATRVAATANACAALAGAVFLVADNDYVEIVADPASVAPPPLALTLARVAKPWVRGTSLSVSASAPAADLGARGTLPATFLLRVVAAAARDGTGAGDVAREALLRVLGAVMDAVRARTDVGTAPCVYVLDHETTPGGGDSADGGGGEALAREALLRHGLVPVHVSSFAVHPDADRATAPAPAAAPLHLVRVVALDPSSSSCAQDRLGAGTRRVQTGRLLTEVWGRGAAASSAATAAGPPPASSEAVAAKILGQSDSAPNPTPAPAPAPPTAAVAPSSVPPGLAVLERGQEFQVLDDVLPAAALRLLRARVASLPGATLGADSFFIPFTTPLPAPRSLVELLILEHLAPAALGDLAAARDRLGFLGAEWWVQARDDGPAAHATTAAPTHPALDPMRPKEYHYDTAITWCRDNGWPPEMLEACHFFPAVGSVFYLSEPYHDGQTGADGPDGGGLDGDCGGPTVVFNQSRKGRSTWPPLPSEVAVVRPRANRLLLFRGHLYHGVLHAHGAPACGNGDGDANAAPRKKGACRRVTLLVNYWFNKTAGESHTPRLPLEDRLVAAARDVLAAPAPTAVAATNHGSTARAVALHNVSEARDFRKDIISWKQQCLPAAFASALAAAPAVLLRLLTSEASRYMTRDDVWAEGTMLQPWPLWTADPVTGELTMVTVTDDADRSATKWVLSRTIPGGNPYADETRADYVL